MTLQAGTRIGRYEIIEPIGQGGMAVVYRARQPALDRVVALKVIRSGYSEDPEFLERFRREARAVARLDHPNVVQVFDFEEIDGRAVLALQLLEGESLKERVEALAGDGRRLPVGEVVRIVDHVAAGLAYAHALGVVHRDIKPANVLFTRDGRAVVTDFGIARMLGGTQLTQTGVGIGTPEYMSPEQGQGGELSPRSDVYSLGVLAYELLTGDVPFSGDTPFAVVLRHVRDPLPPASSRDRTIPASVDAVLAKALAKDPAQRHQGVLDLAGDLRRALGKHATLPTMRTSAATGAAKRGGLTRARDFVILAAFAGVMAVTSSSLGPGITEFMRSIDEGAPTQTPRATASPGPTPRQITLRPEQMIMPPEDLPITQYEVRTDEAFPVTSGGGTRWRRLFSPTRTGEFGNIEFRLTVYEPGRSASPDCESWTWSAEKPVETTKLPVATLGDRSALCRFRFSDGTRWFISWVADRNVSAETHLFARVNASDGAATDLAMSLAQKQVAIIARVAPR